jgi:hypothetical protein
MMDYIHSGAGLDAYYSDQEAGYAYWNKGKLNMTKTKFDLVFEEVMQSVSDNDLYGTDIYNTTLKVFKWNRS